MSIKRPTTETVKRPCVNLSQLREALAKTLTHARVAHAGMTSYTEKVNAAIAHLDQVIPHQINQRVYYRQGSKARWKKGVVVAYMVCEPFYVCGAGDDRDARPRGKLLAVRRDLVRSR